MPVVLGLLRDALIHRRHCESTRSGNIVLQECGASDNDLSNPPGFGGHLQGGRGKWSKEG